MSQLSHGIADQLARSYEAYYDVERIEDGSELAALCHYYKRESQYVGFKSAELWAAESHEYLYLWDVGELTPEKVQKIFDRVLDDGEPRVKPHSQHMYTYLTAVVLYDSTDAAALAQLKKLKKRREFKLSLHGWMEFRIAAVDVSTVEFTASRSAKCMEKDLVKLVARIKTKYFGEEK